MPWQPYKKQEPTVPDGIWIANVEREVIVEQSMPKPIAFPARPGVVKTWRDEQQEAVDRAAVILAGYLMAITRVGAGILVGLVISWVWNTVA